MKKETFRKIVLVAIILVIFNLLYPKITEHINNIRFRDLGVKGVQNELNKNLKGIEIYVNEFKASPYSGYIKGNITKKDEGKLYLEFIFIDRNNVELSKKYLNISNLEKDKNKDFKVSFHAKHVVNVKINLLNKLPDFNVEGTIAEFVTK